jgi:biotin carboxyl carrier protein
MAEGWIKLHRKLSESDLWLSEPFTRGQAWTDLLMIANHDEGFIRVRGIKIAVHRGQVGWSEVRLAERWHWSRTKVRSFILELQKEQQLEQQKNNKSSIITLVNFEMYQGKEQQEEQQKEPQKNSRKTAERQQKDTNKNDKNDKNLSNSDSNGRFIKPTIEEITAYCKERGNSVDPQKWIDHYTSNGWMVGRNKMKDWKSAVRTWENNSKGGTNNGQAPRNIGTNQTKPNKYSTLDFSKLE